MLLGLVLLAVGIALLAFAADAFVDGAASLAQVFNVSPVLVGALVIGFGTSLPEMLVSAVAAYQGDADLGVGNVVGSNVANLSLVLGVAALICAVEVSRSVIRTELPLCVGSVLLFAVFVQTGFTRREGVLLLIAMLCAIFWIVKAGQLDDDDEEADNSKAAKQLAVTIAGLIGTVAGSWMLVNGALRVADELNLSGGFVGLTLVAIGTSLPELVTAIVAARKGETGLIIGNLLGSNVFNSLAVGAVLGLVGPGPLSDGNLAGIATWIMIAVVLIAAAFIITGQRVQRIQAVVLLAIYAITMPFTASTDESTSDQNAMEIPFASAVETNRNSVTKAQTQAQIDALSQAQRQAD